jgi:hypothetical protein
MAALPLPVVALKNPEEAIQHVEKYVPALCAYLNIWYVDIGDKQFQYTCLIEEPLDSLTQAHKNFYIEDMKYFFRKNLWRNCLNDFKQALPNYAASDETLYTTTIQVP